MVAGTFNLQVLRGLDSNRSLLSCTPQGKVDLFSTDDHSGRQVWNVVEVPGVAGYYNIIVSKGTDPGKKYLSCTRAGDVVDLWKEDDESGRQRWQLIPVTKPAICSYYEIKVLGGVDTKRNFLSCAASGQVVDLWDKDDDSGRQRWQLQPV
jgi:hypothetical protein